MRRDFDIIREVLIKIEDSNENRPMFRKIEIEGYTLNDVDYNINLLLQNKFIEAETRGKGIYMLKSMTYKGHDLLDNIRDKSFFEKIKKHTKENGIPLTFDTIKAIVPVVVKSLLL